ncbi:MAG: hypothetical protein K2L12_05875 [Clostridia bacterium]|nr:hypothetical protein [Clostridia bacterium]
MKKRLLLVLSVIAIFCLFISGCDVANQGSLKSITRPYIAQYECVSATLGGEDIKDRFECFEIVLKDRENFELIYQPKDGEKHIYKSKYEFDIETRELTADISVLGYKFKPTVTVQNGKFTIVKQIGTKQLVLNFKAK